MTQPILRLSMLGAVILIACAPDEAAAPPVAAAPPNVVQLTSTEYAFQAPDTITAGWTTFQLANHGNEVHYGHIVRLDTGRTVQDLVDAYLEAIRTSGPRPSWVTRFGGPGGAAPHGSAVVTQYLEPGSYVWICPVEDQAGDPHFAKGEVKPFVVVAAAEGTPQGAAPTATATIRLKDFSFEIDSALQAGRHTVRVENAGTEPHDLVLMKLAEGRTLNDIVAWMNPEQARRPEQSDEPPPSLESMGMPAGGHAAIRSGMDIFFDTDLTPGEYIVLCMATAPDGRSHIEHGMAMQFTVR